MRLEEIDVDEWARALPSEGYSAFHAPEALEVIADHTSATMRLIAGYNGQEPVALLPVYVKDESIGKLVLSPPPGFGIRGLGPILMPSSPKRGKLETINNEFSRGVIDALDADAVSTLFLVTADTVFQDPRPYDWAGFNVETRYTYQLDLESRTPDELLTSFSKSLRREIKSASDDIPIRTGGRSAARAVHQATKDRYEDQGMGFGLSPEFLMDMVSSLGDQAEVYLAETPDGEFLSGIVVVYSSDTAYFWKGGTRQTQVDYNVNSLLHWRAIKDILEEPARESIDTYDFSTANNPNIVRFKRKFGGELTPYHRIESKSLPMTLAKGAYRFKQNTLFSLLPGA